VPPPQSRFGLLVSFFLLLVGGPLLLLASATVALYAVPLPQGSLATVTRVIRSILLATNTSLALNAVGALGEYLGLRGGFVLVAPVLCMGGLVLIFLRTGSRLRWALPLLGFLGFPGQTIFGVIFAVLVERATRPPISSRNSNTATSTT
jgi:hypothetical protein